MRSSKLKKFFEDNDNWCVNEILDHLTHLHSPNEIRSIAAYFLANRESIMAAYWRRKNSDLLAKTARPAPPRKPGFIYLCRNHRNGLTKIGFSRDPQRREHTLQSEEPDISIIATLPGTITDEQTLHKHFLPKRVRGEWFKLSDSDCETIASNRKEEVMA